MVSKVIYDNYIYMSICEVTLSVFEESNYNTYQNFCKTFNDFLRSRNGKSRVEDLTYSNYYMMSYIIEVLNKVYSIDNDDISSYMLSFFSEEKYLIFEKVVRAQKKLFPNSNIESKSKKRKS